MPRFVSCTGGVDICNDTLNTETPMSRMEFTLYSTCGHYETQIEKNCTKSLGLFKELSPYFH